MRSKKEAVKKERERHYLNGFLNTIKWKVTSIEDFESPDFIVTIDGKRIGIEVCQIFKENDTGGSQLKREEVSRSKYLGNLSTAYYAKGGKPVNLQILGDFLALDTNEIVDLIRNHTPDEISKKIDIEKSTKHGSVYFYITRLPDYFSNYSRWTCINNSIGWRHQLALAKLQKTVQLKANFLCKYKENAQAEIVLLLVADRTQNSGMVHYDETQGGLISRGFHQVYLYEYPEAVKRISSL